MCPPTIWFSILQRFCLQLLWVVDTCAPSRFKPVVIQVTLVSQCNIIVWLFFSQLISYFWVLATREDGKHHQESLCPHYTYFASSIFTSADGRLMGRSVIDHPHATHTIQDDFYYILFKHNQCILDVSSALVGFIYRSFIDGGKHVHWASLNN